MSVYLPHTCTLCSGGLYVHVCAIVIAQWVACLHKEPSSEPQILIFPNEIIRILFQTMQSLSLCRSHSLSHKDTHTMVCSIPTHYS